MRKKNKFDWIEFGFNLSSSMFFLSVGIVFIGSVSLYTSLIAETGLLNLDVNKSSSAVNVNVHTTKIYSGFPPSLKQELNTPLSLDSNGIKQITDNIFIKSLKEPNDNAIVMFIKNILIDMIGKNYVVINTVYSVFYKLPESLALCLSFYATPLLLFAMFFINMGLAGFCHVVHIGELFVNNSREKSVLEKGVESLSNASKNPMLSMGNYLQNINVKDMVIAILYLIFLAFPMVMFICPSIVMMYSYLSPLLAVFTNLKTHKKYNIIEYVIDMLSYKRQLIMWLISLTMVRVVYMSLGIYDALSCLVSIMVLAAFTRIYSQYVPSCNTTSK